MGELITQIKVELTCNEILNDKLHQFAPAQRPEIPPASPAPVALPSF